MMRVASVRMAAVWAAVVVMGGCLTACGDDASGSASTASSGSIDRSVSTGTGSTSTAASGTATAEDATSNPDAVTLSWDAPTENADGTALTDLQGYKVHYGSESKVYSDTIQVSNPGLTTYVVQNLPAGTYYFAVTSYNSKG